MRGAAHICALLVAAGATVLSGTGPAAAVADYCAVVVRAPAGGLPVVAAPRPPFEIVARVRSGTYLGADTRHRNGAAGWTHVTAALRRGRGGALVDLRRLDGWLPDRHVRQVRCEAGRR